MKFANKTMACCLMSSIVIHSFAHAGGFSLYTEGSAAAIGNFAAGIAAEVLDASTGWYNPAGLVYLNEEQALISGVGVLPSTTISGNSTFRTTGFPSYTQTFTNLQAGRNALVPAFHYAVPLGERAAFGFSVVSPFGLSTKYSSTSPVRYAATFTELMTVDVSPDIAGKLTDNLSVGVGLDIQWSQVTFNQVLGAPSFLLALGRPPDELDSSSVNKGTSMGIGFHAGMLAMFNHQHTRLGVNYQSRMQQSYTGNSELTGPLADPALVSSTATFQSNALFSNNVHFPEIVTLSAYQDVGENLTLLGSVVYTGWNVFNTIQLNNVAAFSLENGQTFRSFASEEHYRNVWRYALGGNYRVADNWILRFGAGYDETPTINAYRNARLPDVNRWALSIGSHYQVIPEIGIDVGYTYLFGDGETTINKTNVISETSSYNVNARGNAHANLLGIQAVWTLDTMKNRAK